MGSQNRPYARPYDRPGRLAQQVTSSVCPKPFELSSTEMTVGITRNIRTPWRGGGYEPLPCPCGRLTPAATR
jgi:hypothetical protein